MLMNYKLIIIGLLSGLLMSCSTASNPAGQMSESSPVLISNNTTNVIQFPAIARARAELDRESDAINGKIVQDYSLNSYSQKIVNTTLQQNLLLTTTNFLFVPINSTSDQPVFEDISLPNRLNGISYPTEDFLFYRDPMLAKELLDKNKKISPSTWATRERTLMMANDVLNNFIAANPNYLSKFESAAGFAVFDITSVSAVLYVGGWGSGVIFDNDNKATIYTNYFRAGNGLGLGYIGQYFIYVFNNHFSIEQFIGIGGGADIGASGTFGIWGKYFSFNPMIDTYQVYKYGANFQGNWGGSLYWQSPGLN